MRWLVTAGGLGLAGVDSMRRLMGRGQDLCGLGPQPTPSRLLVETPALRVRTYAAAHGRMAPLLLVAAPIKRAYIWDLMPQVSTVRLLLEAGFGVSLVEWRDPEPVDGDWGLDSYVEQFLGQAVAAVREASGGTPLLVGHSLGGTMAAIFAARHPDRVRGVVLLEAPLQFGADAGAFAPVVAVSPDLRPLPTWLPMVPGSLLDLVTVVAAPREFLLERYLDLVGTLGRPEAQVHVRVQRWTLDEFALPGRLFADIVENLYRDDQFRRGELVVAGRRVGPNALVVPLLNVVDPRSAAIPPSAIEPFHHAAASQRKALLEYHGDRGVGLQHVGVLIGRHAHAMLWPQIIDWIRQLA
jgi:polyhydroxyalkanoate synthase